MVNTIQFFSHCSQKKISNFQAEDIQVCKDIHLKRHKAEVDRYQKMIKRYFARFCGKYCEQRSI